MQIDQTSSLSNEFNLIKRIGKGTFSIVWLAKCISTGQFFALKVISKDAFDKSERSYNLIKKEVKIHKQLDHKNIALFYKIFENDEQYFIMMEYIKGNTLFNVANSMRKHGFPLIESDIRKYFIQLLSAVNYLHNDLHIIHRDLKLDNIMIDVDDNAKIVDFGFSSYIDDHDELKEARGSLRYAAPEIFIKQESTTAVDMWALGVILYYCFTGFFPFDSKNSVSELASKVLFGKVEYSSNISHNAKSLMKGLFRKNPHKRMTCKEAMQHPWIEESDINENNDSSDISQSLVMSAKINNQNNVASQASIDSQLTSHDNTTEKNMDSCNSKESINSTFLDTSKEYASPNQNKSALNHLCEKKEVQSKKIKTSKSIFSENILKTKHQFIASGVSNNSNHKKMKQKRVISNC